jgi:recombinational DNA repair protein (RecF pathway)
VKESKSSVKLNPELYNSLTESLLTFTFMKRAFLLTMISVYLLSSVGIAINKFYCCGELKSITIAETSAAFADCKMPVKAPGCCDKSSKTFKVKDQHLASGSVTLTASPIVSILNSLFQFDLVLPASVKESVAFNYHAPPDLSGKSLLILNCTYRI